jgi:hypothetical protein
VGTDPTKVLAIRRRFKRGLRVRFLEFGEPDRSRLPVGSEGSILHVDAMGTVHVAWDIGLTLGLIVIAEEGRTPDRLSIVSSDLSSAGVAEDPGRRQGTGRPEP